MKTLQVFAAGTLLTLLIISGCRRNENLGSPSIAVEETGNKNSPPPGPCNPNAYQVLLVSKTLVGSNFEWVWSVQNLNPGNGNNGTSQDLSHWGMQFGTCFNWASVVGAAYSFNNVSWNSFTPSYHVDPSQGCLTTPVLKFDVGTSGTAKTYYKLITSQDYTIGASLGYYKSGSRTGCCTFSFTGIGCGIAIPPDDGGGPEK